MSIKSLTDPVGLNISPQNITVKTLNYTTLNPPINPGASLFVTVSNAGGGGEFTGSTQQAIIDGIAQVVINGGGTLFIKSGTYNIASTITLPANVNIQGESRQTTILQANGCLIMIESTTLLTGSAISNFSLNGYSTTAHMRLIGQGLLLSQLSFSGSDGVNYTPTGLHFTDDGATIAQFNSATSCSFGDFGTQHILVSPLNWNAAFENCFLNNGPNPCIGIKNDGFSLKCVGNYFIFCTVGIYTNLTCLNINSIYANCDKCNVINHISPPLFPIPMSMPISNAFVLSFGQTISFVECNVAATLQYLVTGNFTLSGAPLLGTAIQFTGTGTKQYQINCAGITTVSDDGLGSIAQDSYFNQPLIPQTVAPTPIYAMTYLADDGAGNLSQQRWDGAAWKPF